LPKIIALLPVYNEQNTLPDILPRVARHVDWLVCVNDGSRDHSLDLLRNFARKRKNTFIVDLPANSGMAGALKQGFLFVLYLLEKKKVGEGDVVVTIDADGQHKPEYIPALVRHLAAQKADVVLTQRDFSVYPLYKIWGNRFLTWTNSILSGKKYNDVESGLRLLKAKTLRPVLKYYRGVKYSCAQEIALISARSGFKIDNEFKVEVPRYRAGTTVWDGFIVLALSLWVFFRLAFRISSPVTWDPLLMEKFYRQSRSLWRSK
jgi:UDP-N-acetylglucosamine---dolichyl-phosphate N-acetylglucosaminyltransferase